MSANLLMPGVKVYKCPDVAFRYDATSSSGTGKRKRAEASKEEDNMTNSQKSRKEVQSFMSKITDLASTTARGMEKLHHKQDILTQLGVPPPKEQKMPLKMKLGIIDGRKKRAERMKNEAKESGYVGAIPFLLKQASEKRVERKSGELNILSNTGLKGAQNLMHSKKKAEKKKLSMKNLSTGNFKKKSKRR